MKYIKQILIILVFTGLGEVLAYLIPLPIPAAIYGIILMFTALATGILKVSQVKETSQFLISIMTVLFVPVCVKILEYWGIISRNLAAIFIILTVSTFLVFALSALVTQWLLKRKGGKRNG